MNSASMRSVGSKSFGFKIELMKWSNRMDLLAFSNEKGSFFGVCYKMILFFIIESNLKCKMFLITCRRSYCSATELAELMDSSTASGERQSEGNRLAAG